MTALIPLQFLHDILFAGSLKQGEDWGGGVCAAYVPMHIHVKESITWILVLILLSVPLNLMETMHQLGRDVKSHLLKIKKPFPTMQRNLEICVAILMFTMFVNLLCIKIWNHALIVLLQPCHMLLIIQGIALLYHGPLSVYLTLLTLPPLTGSLMALIIPSLNGLNQFEQIQFYVQHIAEALIPIYLLCRNEFCALKSCNFRVLAIGQLSFDFLHFTMYEGIGLAFHVNPQFMLCPTLALQEMFKSFPPYLLMPSYRTTVSTVFSIIAMIEAYLYIGLCNLIFLINELRNDMLAQTNRVVPGGKSESISSSFKSNLPNYKALQGMKGLYSAWVVACHVATILAYVQAIHPDPLRIQTIHKSVWYVAAVGLGYQVDAFFMLSGFLLANTMVSRINAKSKKSTMALLCCRLINYMIKRLFRFWPTFVAVIVFCMCLGDYNSFNFNQSFFSSVFTFPIGQHVPLAFAASWSNRIDLECCLILIVVMSLLRLVNALNIFGAVLTMLLSLVPKFYRFLSDPSLSYLALGREPIAAAQKYLPIFFTPDKQVWLKSLTNLPPNEIPGITMSILKQKIISSEYLVQHQRITPFFIGVTSYLVLMKITSNSKATKISGDHNAFYLIKTFIHNILLSFSVVMVFAPILIALLKLKMQPASEGTSDSSAPPPSFAFEVIFNVLGRSLFAGANAYVLISSLVPDTSIIHSSLFKSLFEHPTLQFMGQLSFGVYMTHFIIVVYVTMIILKPDRLDALIGTDVFHHFIVCFSFVYVMSLSVAYLLNVYIERPCLIITNKFRYWFSVNSDDKIKVKGQ